jgi:RNA polymerase primary sigma factor
MRRPRGRSIAETERQDWLRRRRAICSYVVEHNLGLVYLCVSRLRFAQVELDELRSEGLLAMVRAVDWFDPWMGVRFSTYAYNAITRGLVRLNQRAGRHRRLFPATYDNAPPPVEPDNRWAELYVDRLHQALKKNDGELSEREFTILRRRFPWGEEPRLTLEQVGDECGLSKERVRQIQNRALKKLRTVLDADPALQ